MHEYSVVQSLMGHIEAQARAHRATAVREVTVRLGELSGVDPDLLKSAYELIREKTICATAPLAITTVPAEWACRQCASTVPAGGPLRCPACGAPARLVSGDEILLERLDLEVPDV